MLDNTATIAKTMPVDVDMWQVQNIYFTLLQKQYPAYVAEAAQDPRAAEWTRTFEHLGEQLSISVRKGEP